MQGQVEHLAWRLGDDAQETSGLPIKAWYFSHIVSLFLTLGLQPHGF